MNLIEQIQQLADNTFEQLGYDLKFARITKSQREGFDFQCNGAMPLGKILGVPAFDLAEQIGYLLEKQEGIGSVLITGKGASAFINIMVDDSLLEANLQPKSTLAETTKKIMLDFGGPNVAKPLHVGHLRSLVIGESLRRILLERGHTVLSDIHLGDWGLQMGQLISQLQIEQPDLVYFNPGFVGAYPEDAPISLEQLELMYPKAALACKEDPVRMDLARQATAELQQGRKGFLALWKHFKQLSLNDQLLDVERLGAYFNFLLGESDVNDLVIYLAEQLADEHVAIPSDGALIIPVSKPEDRKEVPPLILQKSDGAATYGATDLATIIQRRIHDLDEIIYVVDERQAQHFEQVFRAAELCEVPTKLTHVGFGTVNGPDGKPFKTRDGGTVKLKQLLADAVAQASVKISDPLLAEQVGLAAIKFGDLHTNRLSGYNFDLDKFLEFEGKTGPYLQYAGVRIKSILSKLPEIQATPIKFTSEYEHFLAVQCLGYDSALASAETDLMPSRIAEYAFELAQLFSRFYSNCPVLGEPPAIQYTRKCLIQLTFKRLEKCLHLLGIEVPARM